MTPNDIEVLFHYHCCTDPHPRAHAPAVRDALNQFLSDGILRESGLASGFVPTERGAKFIEMLLSTPYPQQSWVDPREAK